MSVVSQKERDTECFISHVAYEEASQRNNKGNRTREVLYRNDLILVGRWREGFWEGGVLIQRWREVNI